MFKLPRKDAIQRRQVTTDQREATHLPAQSVDETSVIDRFGTLFTGYRLSDIFTARYHSEDFRDTRADYITVRLRFMAFFFALAVPLWIPVDYFTIQPEHFEPMAISRAVLAGLLVLLGALTFGKVSYRKVSLLLGLVILLPIAFYVAALLILASGETEPASVGYSFMPFLMVGLLGLFPLTLVFGLSMATLILAAVLGLELWFDTLLTLPTLNKLWLFVMFTGVSLWIQSGQLLMLLKLYRESTRDPLTGLINRRVLIKRLAAEQALFRESGRPFSILMFDLDRFKRINDTYGHLTGDEVLKAAAQVLENQLRRTDIIARFGGEEFVAVLPGLSCDDAIRVAERIRKTLRNTRVTAPNGDAIALSSSIGVTEYEPDEPIEAAISRVDDSLYKAKELGRNRVVYSQSGDAEPLPAIAEPQAAEPIPASA